MFGMYLVMSLLNGEFKWKNKKSELFDFFLIG